MHGAIYKCWKKKLMKINLFLKFLFIIYILLFWKVSNAFESSVAEKYKEIFSKNILSQDDIENYRLAYKFQDECKWKSANKHIIKISDKIFL